MNVVKSTFVAFFVNIVYAVFYTDGSNGWCNCICACGACSAFCI